VSIIERAGVLPEVRDGDDARELERGIDAARQRDVREPAGRDEQHRQQEDRAGLPAGETRGVHFS
jgi:hypothetical protein